MRQFVDTKTTTTLKIDKLDLISMLVRTGTISSDDPVSIDISFEVPRGGDYSGMSVDIDEDNPITIIIKE